MCFDFLWVQKQFIRSEITSVEDKVDKAKSINLDKRISMFFKVPFTRPDKTETLTAERKRFLTNKSPKKILVD